jgi:hypothetical protein
MTFLGTSSSRAGVEPGRSGFPASYTSLLNCPLGCPAEGGFSGPLSGPRHWCLNRPAVRRRTQSAHHDAAPSAAERCSDGRKVPTAARTSAFGAMPALDLPTGFAFSPWVSASVTCPGVRTSSPAPGAFAGLLSTGDFDNDHRH